VAIGFAILHVVNCLTGRCGWPGLLISLAQIGAALVETAERYCRVNSKRNFKLSS
jgi:hypothetical protein